MRITPHKQTKRLVTDAEETYGLIVDSSGTRYKTNPYKKDTDGDGLNDNEEVEVNRVMVETTDEKGNKVINLANALFQSFFIFPNAIRPLIDHLFLWEIIS